MLYSSSLLNLTRESKNHPQEATKRHDIYLRKQGENGYSLVEEIPQTQANPYDSREKLSPEMVKSSIDLDYPEFPLKSLNV